MKLYIEGPINRYYVQTLGMIFFPGSKFSDDEQATPETPQLWVSLTRDGDAGVNTHARFAYLDKTAEADRRYEYREDLTRERVEKIAVGDVVISAFEAAMGYRPAWGMLTGVRPSKVATELLQKGLSKTRVKKQINKDYFVIPKKASLATEIAVNEQRLIGVPSRTDCSVYISIPFCPTKCAYCSFVSYTSKSFLALIPQYLDLMMKEMEAVAKTVRELGLTVKTVYIGGGTPTILTADQLRMLLGKVSECFDVKSLMEYTLEAGRPDTIDAEKMAVIAEYGVNRVSVNPQILCDEVLENVKRAHNCDMFFKAYDIARNAGIPIVNTDLIAGLPGDRFQTFSASFDKILQLRPENITVHTFCVKKAAELSHYKDSYSMRGGDTGKSVDYSQIQSAKEGYIPYYMYRQKNTVGNLENVGFALPGTEGLYNIFMMEEVHSIFAVGAGAVTKLVDYRPNGKSGSYIERLFNPKFPYEYLDRKPDMPDPIEKRVSDIRRFYEQRILTSAAPDGNDCEEGKTEEIL